MSVSIKILIVEDNILIAQDMKNMLEDMEYEVVDYVTNYKDALLTLSENKIDLALLDIQLAGDKTGIDVGEIINKKYHIPFIFVTSNSDKETIAKAKKVNPAGFLVKPFDEKSLFSSIEIGITNFQNRINILKKEQNIHHDFIFVKDGYLFKKVLFNDILYIKADNVYVDVFTKSKTITVRSTLKNFLERLPSDQFIKINKSYVINIRKVEAFNTRDVIINGNLLPLSKEYKEQLKLLLLDL